MLKLRQGRFTLALFSTALSLGAAEFERPRAYALQNVKIVHGDGSTTSRGVVTLRGGLIGAAGSSAEIAPEAWVIDGDGLTVYPGFILALSSLGMPEDESEENEGPQSAGPQDRPATWTWKPAVAELALAPEQARTWRRGGVTTAAIAPRGGLFSGQASLVNLAEAVGPEQVIEPRAAVIVRLPIKRRGYKGYPGALLGRIAYVRQTFLDARHYEGVWRLYRKDPAGLERPRYDRALESLVEALAAERTTLYPANTPRELRRGVRLAQELSLPLALYGVQAAYDPALAAEMAAANVAALVDVSWPEPPQDPDPEAEPSLETLRFRDRAPAAPAALAEAGVRFALYASKADSPEKLFAGVRKAITAGLEESAAVRALTLDAARLYGVDDRLGSITPGKIANLVVYESDPFAEEAKPRMVFVDGRLDEVE